MPKLIDLSGHWTGYYTQHDHRRPISADLSQDGDRLSGLMNDACTAFESSISELVMEEGLPPGTDEQLVEHLRSAFPDAPPGPVRAEVRLPSTSVLEGEVNGRSVQFLKTYQGQHFKGFRIGDTRLGQLGTEQEVIYRGRVSADGSEIEGRWQIPGDPSLALPMSRTQGGFVLRRDPHLPPGTDGADSGPI